MIPISKIFDSHKLQLGRVWENLKFDKRYSRTLVASFGLLGVAVTCYAQLPSPPDFSVGLPISQPESHVGRWLGNM